MPNVINYASKYSSDLIDIIVQGLLTAPFLTTNVDWLDAKSFHFTQMSVGSFGNHARTGGYNSGSVNQTDKVFTLAHDRDVEFLVDVADVDESAQTAAIGNVAATFVSTQQIPEMDALTFERICTAAQDSSAVAGSFESTALTAITKDNVYSTIVGWLGKARLKYYRARGSLVGYVRSEIMDLLATSTEIQKTMEIGRVVEDGVETRIVRINGVPLFEVVDTDRFYSKFTYSTTSATVGFEPAADAVALNAVFASVETVHTVPKIESIYVFFRGTHTKGDGDLYQHRSMWDTFIFPNGKDAKIDSVYVNAQPAAGTDDEGGKGA